MTIQQLTSYDEIQRGHSRELCSLSTELSPPVFCSPYLPRMRKGSLFFGWPSYFEILFRLLPFLECVLHSWL
jgi:hypothetical protein